MWTLYAGDFCFLLIRYSRRLLMTHVEIAALRQLHKVFVLVADSWLFVKLKSIEVSWCSPASQQPPPPPSSSSICDWWVTRIIWYCCCTYNRSYRTRLQSETSTRVALLRASVRAVPTESRCRVYSVYEQSSAMLCYLFTASQPQYYCCVVSCWLLQLDRTFLILRQRDTRTSR